MAIAVTSLRKLTPDQAQEASAELAKLLAPRTGLLVGDATGLDALAAQHAAGLIDLHLKNPALAAGATLHAWPRCDSFSMNHGVCRA
jgi:hypothetical protein